MSRLRDYGRKVLHSANGVHLRTVSNPEANSLLRAGEVQERCRFCKRGPLDAQRNLCTEGRSEHYMVLFETKAAVHPSNATIRMREMLANAGIAAKDSIVQAARVKVEDWGAIQRQVFEELTVVVPA